MRAWVLAGACGLSACGGEGSGAAGQDDATAVEAGPSADAARAGDAVARDPDAGAAADAAGGDAARGVSGPPVDPPRSIAAELGRFRLRPFEESLVCAAWTLHNEAPLYVQRVRMQDEGAMHHSNWFVVPEEMYPGPDGLFPCRQRNFDEVKSALEGTVLFAQSTQSQFEEQDLGPGVVVKIPPRHKVVVNLHLLNLAGASKDTAVRLALEAIHPGAVRTVVTPFRMTYQDLHLPPRSESRFTSSCDLSRTYAAVAHRPFDLKLYWLLPHYHSLGNHFRVEVLGGPRDGEALLDIGEFDAEANGRAFDPPVDLSGADGLRLTCGYRNPRSEAVGWGIGDQEMCDLLGFADSAKVMDAGVYMGGEVVEVRDGISFATGPCRVVVLPKNAAQSMPTAEEIAGPLEVPASPLDPETLAGPPPCADTPDDAVPAAPATLPLLERDVFRPACAFGACHGPHTPAAGLDLASPGLHARLLAHDVQAATDLPLVRPGDPEGSWLYRRVAQCAPLDGAGHAMPHMPLNAPTLLDPSLVAGVRDWIAAGAPPP